MAQYDAVHHHRAQALPQVAQSSRKLNQRVARKICAHDLDFSLALAIVASPSSFFHFLTQSD